MSDVVGSVVVSVADGGRIIDWRIEAVGLLVTVQSGKSERGAVEAMGEDSVRREEAERRRGWERWSAEGK